MCESDAQARVEVWNAGVEFSSSWAPSYPGFQGMVSAQCSSAGQPALSPSLLLIPILCPRAWSFDIASPLEYCIP